jgi:hypothetical protein
MKMKVSIFAAGSAALAVLTVVKEKTAIAANIQRKGAPILKRDPTSNHQLVIERDRYAREPRRTRLTKVLVDWRREPADFIVRGPLGSKVVSQIRYSPPTMTDSPHP